MKTLENHVILYDADCPMCNLYSQAFVKSKMLDQEGRASYQNMPVEVCPLVDQKRAVNEIALVNTITGEVSYGINSLFKVIGNAIPIFRPLFSFKPFIGLMSKVYAFISYNRRVIIPVKKSEAVGIQPTFRLDYRVAYLLFTWFVTAVILSAYARILNPIVPIGANYREYLICGAQILVQGVVVSLFAADQRWDYLGNMMTISFAGALLLLPMLVIAHYFRVPDILAVLYFMGVAGLMFLEHIRRTNLLALGWWLTASWAAYRLIVLFLIFN